MKLWTLTVLTLLLVSPSASGQAAPGRSGDLNGVWFAEFATPLERPPFAAGRAVAQQDAEAFARKLTEGAPVVIDPDISGFGISKLANVGGELRTSVIVEPADGRMPYSSAGGKAAGESFQKFNFAYDHPEDRSLQERCLAGFGAPPMRVIPTIIPMRIVQTASHVVINLEDVAGVRIVQLGGSSPPEAVQTLHGFSKGHWDGATLVVETTHFRSEYPERELFGRPVILGAKATVTERFTRLEDDRLLYAFTVDDPEHYTQPWSGEFTMQRFAGPDMEYACHEANYSMRNILLGGRANANKNLPPR